MHCSEAPSLVSASVAAAASDRHPAEQLVAAACTPDTAVLAAGRQSCRAVVAADCVTCPGVALTVPLEVVQRVVPRETRRRIPRQRR